MEREGERGERGGEWVGSARGGGEGKWFVG